MNGEKFGGGNNPEAGKNNEQDRQQFQQAGEKTLEVMNGEGNNEQSADEQDKDNEGLYNDRLKAASEMMTNDWDEIQKDGLKQIAEFVKPYEQAIEMYNDAYDTGLENLNPDDLNALASVRRFRREIAEEIAKSDEEITPEALAQAFSEKIHEYLEGDFPVLGALEANFDATDGGEIWGKISGRGGGNPGEAQGDQEQDKEAMLDLTPEEREQLEAYIESKKREFVDITGKEMLPGDDIDLETLVRLAVIDYSERAEDDADLAKLKKNMIGELASGIDSYFAELAAKTVTAEQSLAPEVQRDALSAAELEDLQQTVNKLAEVWGEDFARTVGDLQTIFEDVQRKSEIAGVVPARDVVLDLMKQELRKRAQEDFLRSVHSANAERQSRQTAGEESTNNENTAENNVETQNQEGKARELRKQYIYDMMEKLADFESLSDDEKKKFNQLWAEYTDSDYDYETIRQLTRAQFAKDRFNRSLYTDESLENLIQDIKDGQKYSSGEELAREMEQMRLIQEAQTIMKGRSVEETLKSIDKGIENIVQKTDEYQKQINAIRNVEEVEVLQAQVDRLRDSKIELINRREVVKRYREMQEGAENNNNEMAAADGSVDSLDGLPEAAQRKIAQLEAEVAALTNRLADVEKLTTERREGIIKKCFNKLKARGDKLKAKFRGLITRGLAATLGALMLGGGAGVSQLGNGVVNAAGVESVDDGADDSDGEVDVLDGDETQNFVKNRFVGEDSSYVQSMSTSFGQVDLSGGEEAVDKKAEKGSTYETMPNGLRFNYNAPGGYGSPNKEKPVNYGASVTEKLVNAEQEGKLKEVAIKTIMEMAKNQPEYLAGVASAFPDVYAGIGITEQADSEAAMAQIEQLLETAENGGELQQKLLDGLEGKLKDKDTKFLLEKVNGTEMTHYMKPIDSSKANTPDNLAVQSQAKEYHDDDRLVVTDGEGNSYRERTTCRQKTLKLKKQGWKVVSRGEKEAKVEVVYDVVEDPIVHPDKKDKEDELKQREPKRFIAKLVHVPINSDVDEIPEFVPKEKDIVIDWSDIEPAPEPTPKPVVKDPVVENPVVSDPVINNPVVDNPVVDEQQPVVTPEEEDKTEPVNPGGGDETDSEPEPEPQPEPEEVLEGKNPEDIDKNAENVENPGQNDSSVVAGETTGDSEIIESNREDKNDEALEGEGSDSAGQAEADEGAQTEDMDESQYDDAAEDFINSMNGNKEQSQTQEDAETESGASMSEGTDEGEGDSGDAANSVDGSEQSSSYEDMSSKERENYLDSLLQQAQSSAQQAAGGENATETSQVDNLPQADANTTGTGATTTGGAVNAG